MKLSTSVKETIVRFAAKFPLATNDEESRVWTHKLAQQLAFSFPSEGWGHKSAGGGRPHSADCIAIKAPFVGWDVISGGGAPGAKLQLESDSIDLSGQEFEPVEAVNHIAPAPVDPPIVPPVTPPASNEAVIERLDAILAEVKAQRIAVERFTVEVKSALPSLLDFITKGIKIRF
jgi:hypothetical protein